MTILLVDDDEDDISLFKEVVLDEIDASIIIVVCTNGELCLHTLTNLTPDIIFLDINMPIMNGKECFDSIMKDDVYKNIPIVMHSTSFNPEEVEYYRSRGGHYLTKSASLRQSIESIKMALTSYLRNNKITK